MFYFIRNSLDNSELGYYPQVIEIIYHCDVWETPLFVDKFLFEKIPIGAILANPILHPDALLTDLIYLWDVGFTSKLLVSGKLKVILETACRSGIQFIRCSVFQHGIEYDDYWLLHIYHTNDNLIDFAKSTITVRERKPEGGTFLRLVTGINSFEDFEELRTRHEAKLEVLEINPLIFKKEATMDLMKIGNGGRFAVSEKLKKAIIEANCSGVLFQPCEMPFDEWLENNKY